MKNILLLVITILITTTLPAQQPHVLLTDGNKLQAIKQSISTSDEQKKLVKVLKQKADRYLSMKPLSVMDKDRAPASGDKHDYMSQAAYFWYDSTKPNGLPYMRRDGVRNPEINNITDKKYLGELENATYTLAMAYYLSANEDYAAKAAALLRHWFLNEYTKMNPNLNFGQFVPGASTGRNFGIIETRALMKIADATALLRGSKAWTKHDDEQLKTWYKQYLHWLLTNEMALKEQAAPNNHGTFYDVQVAHFALFTGQPHLAKEAIERAKKRMDNQVDAEAKQPLELERTTALGYSTFNLEAYFQLAILAEHAGIDLWNHRNKHGKNLKDALDWLIPYAVGEKEWTYQQINPYKKDKMYELLLVAADKYKDDRYKRYIKKLGYTEKDVIQQLLLHGN